MICYSETMMKINSNQKGLNIFGLLGAVTVIGLITTIAWLMYGRQDIDSNASSTPVQEQKQANIEPNKKVDNKLSSGWLLRQSGDASIRVPDGFNILVNPADTFDFWLPDQPQGTLEYTKGTSAKIVGEPRKHFELGLIVSYNKAGFNDRGTAIEGFETYDGLDVVVKLFEQTVDPEGVDFPKGAKHYKYIVSKDNDYVNIDYVYLGDGYKNIIEEMVKTVSLK